jgi:hypothetical protein
LAQWDIEPRSPDDFVLDQLDLNSNAVYAVVQQIADSWTRPPGGVHDVLSSLERQGLVRSVAVLRG